MRHARRHSKRTDCQSTSYPHFPRSSWGCGMFKNDTKLMESVIALAEELHFGRAARRLRISQPMLTKNIQDVEALIGGPLFLRDRKHVVLSDAGRAYVQQARLSLLYGERAVQSARAVMQGRDETFHVGRTPYADPFLVSTLLSIQLPLFPRLKIDLASKFSIDIVHDLLAGVVDLAIAHEPPESPLTHLCSGRGATVLHRYGETRCISVYPFSIA